MPFRKVYHFHHFVHHFESTHDRQEVVCVLQSGITFIRDDASRRVETECFRPAEDAMAKSSDALHAGYDFVTIFRVLCSLPFRHPIACVSQPVGTDAQAGWRSAREESSWLSQSHRVESIEHLVGIFHFTHEVATAFVSGEIIVEAIPCRLTDACFLCSAPPMRNIVAGTEHAVWSHVIDIHFARVTSHRLCHAPHSSIARAEKIVPEEHVACQFGVVPGITSHVVAPLTSGCIELMHHVAIVPEAVPSIALYCILVIVGNVLEPCLNLL